MPPSARAIRLRLTASRDEDVVRGAILVGDALGIATLPQARSARHYVVRRLDIGRFARDAAPQTVALQIERRLAHLVEHAVRADDPAAAAAPIVWFDDEASAITALAVRVVAGPPPVEWFWRRIADGALAQPSRDAVVRASLAAAAATPGGPRAVAHVFECIERARSGAATGALDGVTAAALIMRVFGVRPSASVLIPTDAAAVIAGLTAPWRAIAEAWLPRWAGDERAVLLVALALVACGAAQPAPQRLLARAQAIAIAAAATPAVFAESAIASRAPTLTVRNPDNRLSPPPLPPLPPLPVAPPAPPAPLGAADHPAPTVADCATPLLAGATATPSVEALPHETPLTRQLAPAATPRFVIVPDGATTVGGLFFLLRPLAQLDFAGWLDRHVWAAESAFAARLLAGIAHDQAAAADDPLCAALAVPAAADPAPDRPLLRLAWTRSLIRWLAAADLTLDGVVRRSAQIACTTTHIDVCFPMCAVTIGVRLAGLDLDPGWVPWLGRVVRIHYLEELPR